MQIRKMEYSDLVDFKYDIHRSLAKHGQLDLIKDYTVTSLSVTNEDGEILYEPKDENLSVEETDDLSLSMNRIDEIIQSFSSQISL